ncbi:hypothetical protein KDN24_06345 [Bacillus sp. Bva_UNVM-123]|uniref:hypothetical protein n=1 Tax=Bacillus sp. Bva_UNVM-123 TaxID=2829798 RepID=UPI00391F41C6
MENKKKLIIQIPDEIIRNEYFKMDSNTFAVYAYLKFLHFRNYNNSEMKIDHNKFKHKLLISDNRTFKKCLSNLHKNQIILECVTKFPTKGSLSFTFDPIPFEVKTFTQLPATVLNRMEHIGTIGLRLLFYYESFINRKDDVMSQFAFPSIETTSKTLGLSKDTIIDYNELLKRNKLIKIRRQKLECNGEYDNLDNPLFTKYNNHYYVKTENL